MWTSILWLVESPAVGVSKGFALLPSLSSPLFSSLLLTQHLSPNMLEESAISDDIISPEEEGLCSHKFFSEFGFMGLMEYAAQLFNEVSTHVCVRMHTLTHIPST